MLRRFADIDAAVCTTVVGELHHGAMRAQRRERQLAFINDLIANSRILLCDLETAQQYGTLKYKLQLQGTPIPENDIWIASFALQHQLPLATRDNHFDNVPGLTVEKW
jgi:tRNA(fMet)-specific endonuclease VapC